MMRYRLQRKEQIARPNILGNHSFPVYSFRWKDIALSDDRSALEAMMPNRTVHQCGHRISTRGRICHDE